MPEFLEPNRKLLTCEQANRSRICKKQRGVVERNFGRLQQHFRYFEKKVSNKSLRRDFDDLLNVCAILNAFFPPLLSDQGNQKLIAERMHSLMNKPNTLAQLNPKNSSFQTMEDHLDVEFPLLSMDDLYLLGVGTYQLELAPLYYDQHSGGA